jgi:hypothetical protein
MGDLRIGPYVAFVSKFWAVEDVITRSRTASGHVDGAVLACTIMFIRLLMTILRTSRRSPRLDDDGDLIVVAVAEPVKRHKLSASTCAFSVSFLRSCRSGNRRVSYHL